MSSVGNVKGPQFIALHKLFDEVYAAVEEAHVQVAVRAEGER